MKALVIGHNARSKGAYSSILGQSEYDYYSDIAKTISELVPTIDIYERKSDLNYVREMSKVIQSINLHNYDFVLELHFNSASTPNANGCEVLAHKNSHKGQKLSKLFLDALTKEYNLKNRGIINIESSNQRGGYGISKTNCPYILIEPFFANNKEAEKFKDKEKFAKFLLKFISEAKLW